MSMGVRALQASGLCRRQPAGEHARQLMVFYFLQVTLFILWVEGSIRKQCNEPVHPEGLRAKRHLPDAHVGVGVKTSVSRAQR
jgi:hypothetical protein